MGYDQFVEAVCGMVLCKTPHPWLTVEGRINRFLNVAF